jgi:ABC-type phosphate transport system substrate-binding protein
MQGHIVNFQLSRIAAAAGMIVAASAAVANPQSPNVDPSNYTSGTTDVYLAGSSAVDLALTKFIANSCLPSTLDTYRTDAGGRTYYLWTCETNNTAPNFVLASGNTKIAIHKNTNSSSDGVNLVSNAGGTLAYLQVSDLNTSAGQCNVAPTVVAATATIPSYNVYNCGTTAGAAGVGTLSHSVRFGFADSEPKQFNVAAAAQETTVYPLTIVFGVPATKNVRDALQASQGLPVGDEAESSMPSLTTAQVNSLFTGRFTSWSNLGITVAGDNSVYFVRRSGGSGTTRAFDATFITDICIPGATGIAAGTTLVTSTLTAQCNSIANGGTKSLQAGTSDDMANCLSSFQQNGGVGAIGYLSTDYLPGAADGYRWLKVDGFSPKLLNVADGKWKDWS